MRWRTTTVITLLAGSALAAPAAAAIGAPEAEILRQVGEAYRASTSYLFEGAIEVSIQGPRSPGNQMMRFVIAAAPGDRTHDEVKGPMVGGMIVSDGRQTTLYNAPLGQYMRRPGSAASVTAGGPMHGLASVLIARYQGIATGATAARRMADTTLVLAGVKRPCDVLEVSYPPPTADTHFKELPRTFWIEKGTHLVLRQRTIVEAEGPQFGGKVRQEETISIARAVRGGALPDSLWAFRPPAGARQVDAFTNPAAGAEAVSPLAGKPALEFTLPDLAGRPHSLKSLRGKVVLLDFWATWCGPCRITMPEVNKIHKAYRGRGVEVMSVNTGEPAAKAASYIQKNGYAFTTLVDENRRVAQQYQVTGIPTLVVINRAGIVSDYLVGVRDSVALRAALTKAGVK